jgi:hypothetical protein
LWLCEWQIGKAGGDKWKSLSDAVSLLASRAHFNRLRLQLVAMCFVVLITMNVLL